MIWSWNEHCRQAIMSLAAFATGYRPAVPQPTRCLFPALPRNPLHSCHHRSVIQVCVPFNVLISPSNGNPDYGLQVSAEPAVSDAIRWTVGNGTLALETGGFVTSQPIKVRQGGGVEALGARQKA